MGINALLALDLVVNILVASLRGIRMRIRLRGPLTVRV